MSLTSSQENYIDMPWHRVMEEVEKMKEAVVKVVKKATERSGMSSYGYFKTGVISFKRGDSSTHQLMRTMEADGHSISDRVWHECLLYKLKEVQAPDCYVRLVAMFLLERTLCVLYEMWAVVSRESLKSSCLYSQTTRRFISPGQMRTSQ